MANWIWVVIIIGIIAAWYLWSNYGALYKLVTGNKLAVHAAESINRYATDITGLIGAFEATDSTQGSFSSRLGAFFGALPT